MSDEPARGARRHQVRAGLRDRGAKARTAKRAGEERTKMSDEPARGARRHQVRAGLRDRGAKARTAKRAGEERT